MEQQTVTISKAGIHAGAAVTISTLIKTLTAQASTSPSFESLAAHMKRVGNWHAQTTHDLLR